jgi:hypothetical protein
MLVKCINDEITSLTPDNVINNIIMVGDEDFYLPKVGETYTVIGFGEIEDERGEKIACYELGELMDASEIYGFKILFREDRFVIVNQDFVPNNIHNGLLVEEMKLYMDLKYFTK